MRINLQVDSAQLFLRLQNGQRRLAYAVVNAINSTAKRIQEAERRRIEVEFTVRKKEFIPRKAAIIKPLASWRQDRARAEIAIGQRPFAPSARRVVATVVGGPARPRFSAPVTPDLRVGKLRFDRTKIGRRRAGVARTRTSASYRVLRSSSVGKETMRAIYLFMNGERIEPLLHGYYHFRGWVDAECPAQLIAEKAVRKWVKNRGTVRWWNKTRERNEALDLADHCLAALYILEPAFVRSLPGRTAPLSRKVGATAEGNPEPASPPPRRRGRGDGWRG